MSLQEDVLKEISFRTSRSSGSGGQHVNKVETRVEALFNVESSTALSDKQKARIRSRLKNRINAEGILVVSCGETRSQNRNKKIASERLVELITIGLAKKKIRKKTGIPKGAKEKRLKKKRKHSEKKSRRRFDPSQD